MHLRVEHGDESVERHRESWDVKTPRGRPPMTPWDVVVGFEDALVRYTGAPDAVAVGSCTDAIFLVCRYLGVGIVEIPARTYVSVPQAIVRAGGRVVWREEDWQGWYQLRPYPIWDSAKRLRRDMWGLRSTRDRPSYICLSFHARKTLPIGRGGAILTDDPSFGAWAEIARFDGRRPGAPAHDDVTGQPGWHMSMTPEEAARGLWLLSYLPDEPPDQPMDPYPDLRQWDWNAHDPRGEP